MALNEQVFRIHVAIFFDDENVISVLKFANELKEIVDKIFPDDPQILPLPPEAPKEAPRCIFQKTDADANLSFSLERMDYDAGLRVGVDWGNHVEIMAYTLIKACQKVNIEIKRIGIVAQAHCGEELIDRLNEKIQIVDFSTSKEKNISWLVQEHLQNNTLINVVSTIQHNSNNQETPNTIIIDVNTHMDFALKQEEDFLISTIADISAKIGEKLNNVF